MPEMNDTTIPMFKRCSKGDKCIHSQGPLLPATSEYFPRNKSSKDGFYCRCKQCNVAHAKEWVINNREKYNSGARRRYAINPLERKESTQRWIVKNPDKERERHRRYRANHREKYREIGRRQYQKDIENNRARARRYYANNRDRVKKHNRDYARKYPERRRASFNQWLHSNPDKWKAALQRRRARRLSLPASYTEKNWRNALHYFGNLCAYCGNQQGLFSRMKMTQDHFIPLNSLDCSGTVPENILPACTFCNSSKKDLNPVEWLTAKFGKRQTNHILKRINAYFEWVREQDK